MNDSELKERFEREFEPLTLCTKCKAIKVKDKWINPNLDVCELYEKYRKIYGNHITPGLCRRCDPGYKGKEEKPEIDRRRKNE